MSTGVLEMPYANATNVYSATGLPPLSRTHVGVPLTLKSVPRVKRQPVSTRVVGWRINEPIAAPQGGFESADHNVLCEPQRTLKV